MLPLLTVEWLPTIGGTLVTLIGIVAAVGYARTHSSRVWREASEGWKLESEAHKERADRLAADLASTAAALASANMRTDITRVLEVLQAQHKEATAFLKMIAEEADDLKRLEVGEKTVLLLQRIADESKERNGHIAEALSDNHARTEVAWEKITEIAAETLRTVEELRKAAVGQQ